MLISFNYTILFYYIIYQNIFIRAGQFSSSPGQEICEKCPIGYILFSDCNTQDSVDRHDAASDCKLCTGNKYQDETGLEVCKVC